MGNRRVDVFGWAPCMSLATQVGGRVKHSGTHEARSLLSMAREDTLLVGVSGRNILVQSQSGTTTGGR